MSAEFCQGPVGFLQQLSGSGASIKTLSGLYESVYEMPVFRERGDLSVVVKSPHLITLRKVDFKIVSKGIKFRNMVYYVPIGFGLAPIFFISM